MFQRREPNRKDTDGGAGFIPTKHRKLFCCKLQVQVFNTQQLFMLKWLQYPIELHPISPSYYCMKSCRPEMTGTGNSGLWFCSVLVKVSPYLPGCYQAESHFWCHQQTASSSVRWQAVGSCEVPNTGVINIHHSEY